jgi:hypothetical protein
MVSLFGKRIGFFLDSPRHDKSISVVDSLPFQGWPPKNACTTNGFMLNWLCEAPASISIVITTQSIPTELLTPAQFIASGPWRNWHTQLPQEQPFCGFKSHRAYQNSLVL